MRTIVIKEGTDIQKLSARLLSSTGDSRIALDTLQGANPHVNFSSIEPGTIVIVPDSSSFRDDVGASVEGGTFDELRKELLAMVDAGGARVLSGHDRVLSEEKEVTAVLKSAEVKRVVDADPALKAQVDAAAEIFKQDQAQAKAAGETVKTMREQFVAELDGLGKLLE